MQPVAVLLRSGPQTALELSEHLEWHRSRVARDLRLLEAEGLTWRTGSAQVDFFVRRRFSFGRGPSGRGMNAAQLLAQLASDVEIGEGSHTGDQQMTVGAFARGVFLEVGPVTCTMSGSDALGIAAWLGRGTLGPMEWEDVLGTVTCRIVGLGRGEVQVELMAEGEYDVDALWHGSADRVREAIGRSLVLARAWGG